MIKHLSVFVFNILWITAIAAVPVESVAQKEIKYQQVLLKLQRDYAQSATRKDSLKVYNQFSKKYKKYSKKYKHDSVYVRFTFNNAKMAFDLGYFGGAISVFRNIYSEFPDDAKAPISLYYEAYIEEIFIKDKEEAEKLYNLFLDKYPTHDLVHDVQLSLQYIK